MNFEISYDLDEEMNDRICELILVGIENEVVCEWRMEEEVEDELGLSEVGVGVEMGVVGKVVE